MFRRSLLAAGIAAALLFGATPAAAVTAPIGTASAASAQSDLQALVNQYRSANGLQTVSLNGSLSSSATWMAGDMAAKNYFSHTSSDGLSPIQRMAGAGYPAYANYTGEDLAAGFAGAAQVLAGWIASPAHNAVLLNPNYDAVGIGIGYSVTSTYKWYWAADFAGPGVKVAPPPPPAVAPPAPRPAVAPPAVAPPPPRAPAPNAAPPSVATAPPAALATDPVASAADPAPSQGPDAEAAPPSAEPAVDLAAVARAALVVRHEELLVKQMTRLLLRLERQAGF